MANLELEFPNVACKNWRRRFLGTAVSEYLVIS